MKKLLPLILLLTVSAFGQTLDVAVGGYAVNGKLISLTNLSGLSDCASKSVMGKLKKVKIRKNIAYLRLHDEDGNKNVEFHLERLSASDRAIVFLHLVRTGLVLRISGYSCTPDAAITPFSIYRVY